MPFFKLTVNTAFDPCGLASMDRMFSSLSLMISPMVSAMVTALIGVSSTGFWNRITPSITAAATATVPKAQRKMFIFL